MLDIGRTLAVGFCILSFLPTHYPGKSMRNPTISCLPGILGIFCFVTALGCQAQNVINADEQIAGAILPAPENERAGVTVLGYDADGALVTLREGTNDITCIADQPGDDRFHAACYHNALTPYMERGRELRAEGITGQESFEMRHKEADSGTLQMPREPAAVYSVTAPLAEFDPATAHVTLYAVYIPYASQATTGIPETPGPPGTPWIMRPGTASAHIMIIPPKN